MLHDAEKAANEVYKAQIRPLEELLARALEPIRQRYRQERKTIMESTKRLKGT